MFEKKIRYTDYDNNVREETLRFHLSKAELMDMQLSEVGGMKNLLDRMIEEQDNTKLAKYFKDLLLMSYGEKAPDGKHFLKEDEDGHKLYRKFMQTEAYSEMYMWLLTGEEAVLEFVKGIMPEDIEGDDTNLKAINEAREKAKERFEVVK